MPNISITNKPNIAHCAEMMASSNPWKILGFLESQCLELLSHDMIQVYGANLRNDKVSELVGFVASVENGIGFEPLLEFLCVSEAYRSEGIGTTLISYFEDELHPLSANLYLFVSDINPRAAKLYQKLGYMQVGALPDYNRLSQTEFLYRKSRRPKLEHQKNELNISDAD